MKTDAEYLSKVFGVMKDSDRIWYLLDENVDQRIIPALEKQNSQEPQDFLNRFEFL